MRVLILGASGMLGHKLVQSWRGRFDVWATMRGRFADFEHLGILSRDRAIERVDVLDFETVTSAVEMARPDLVVNCIGIVKQMLKANDPVLPITINSLFPHRLASVCRARGCRLVHISTDCVFSGSKGMYSEDDVPDADDLYGRSKLLGEVTGPAVMTIRTSIIGPELKNGHGLLEWFLSNQGRRVKGFTQSFFSGLTTLAFAAVLGDMLESHPSLSGLWHVSAERISKFDLLSLLRRDFQVEVEIEPSPELQVDRSLDSTRFWRLTGFAPPPWEKMVQELASDRTPYREWRDQNGISR